MAIRAHWKGNPTDATEHHYGIPARNLTDEDWAALSTEERDTVRDSKLYRYVAQTRRPRVAGQSTDQEPADSSDDQPDDPVTEEPAVAAEEGETS